MNASFRLRPRWAHARRLAGLFAAFAFSASCVSAASSVLTLPQCLRIALDHNPQLRIASQQFLDAEGRVLRLHAILYPSLNAQALTAPTVLYVQVNEVFYSRAAFPQLRISRLARQQAVINYEQTINDVVFRIRQTFFAALAAQKNVDLIQASAQRQSRAVSSVEALFQGGKVQKSAVLAAQVASNLLSQRAIGPSLRLSQASLALSNLLGQDLPAGTRLGGDLAVRIPASLDVASLTAQALKNRPDLKLLVSLQLTARQQILVDLKNAFPVAGFESNSALQPPAVGATSNFDLERNYDEPEIQRQAGNSQLPVSLYVNWVIFDGGALAGVRASDRADLESREVAIDALKSSIPGEVAAAVTAIRNEEQAQKSLGGTALSDQLRQSGEADYEAGRIRQIDLVNIEADLLNRQELQLASDLRLNLAVAALDHALGRGVVIPSFTSPTVVHQGP